MKNIPILFCLIFLVSCSTASPQGIEQDISTRLPLITPLPARPTPVPILTPTTIPTVKPTAILAGIPGKYNLPKWLGDPESTTAMTISDINGKIYELSLLNLSTSDSSTISISSDLVRGYFWTPDGGKFGFLSQDTKMLFLVDAKSGLVEQIPPAETAVRFLKDAQKNFMEPLVIHGTFPGDFTFLPTYHIEYSANLRYVARQDYQNADNPPVVVEDLETGQTNQITHPSDGLNDLELLWSPVISQLAILRNRPIEGQGGWMVPSGERIEIYQPDGQKVAFFEGEFTSPNWSPDGTKIIYKETSGASPCILDIKTAQKKCLREITRNHPGASSTALLNFSKKGDQIFYIYSGIDESGLCVYGLINGNDFCPTNGLPELEKTNIVGYQISPDEHFFAFLFGGSCASCDYWDDPSVGIIGIDGKGFHTIGKESLVTISENTFAYPLGTLLWRPKISVNP